MSVDTARALMLQVQSAIGQALRELDTLPTPPGPVGGITSIDAFERVLGLAKPNDVITLAPSFVYKTPLRLFKPITIRSALDGVGRMTLDAAAPSFLGGIAVPGDNVTLVGLEVRHPDRAQTVIDITGASCTVDRCRVLGGPTGQKRGIAMNGAGCLVVRCVVEDCWGPYPGDDCQAICAWDTPGPLVIEDCYLSGSTETLMIGGADPSSADRIPSDILIRNNTITKRTAWRTLAVSVKNTLELKNARRVRIVGNVIDQSWGGRGQDGYLLMLTPRNQSNTAPYATVEDVEIHANRCAHGAAAICLLGSDTVHPSQRMARVSLHDNTFTDLDPVASTGSKRLILIQRGPVDVAIVDNGFEGINFTSTIYFDGAPPCEHLTVTGNRFPRTKYGIFGTAATVGLAWEQYVASGDRSGNTEA